MAGNYFIEMVISSPEKGSGDDTPQHWGTYAIDPEHTIETTGEYSPGEGMLKDSLRQCQKRFQMKRIWWYTHVRQEIDERGNVVATSTLFHQEGEKPVLVEINVAARPSSQSLFVKKKPSPPPPTNWTPPDWATLDAAAEHGIHHSYALNDAGEIVAVPSPTQAQF